MKKYFNENFQEQIYILFGWETESLFKVETAYFYPSRKATNQISARIHKLIKRCSEASWCIC